MKIADLRPSNYNPRKISDPALASLKKAMAEFGDLSGQICLDPFLGSGSTLIACEKTSRRCFGMEIDPLYCDVIIKRWEQFTGKKAKRCG